MEHEKRKQSPQNPISGLPSFDDLVAILTHEIANQLNNIAATAQLIRYNFNKQQNSIDDAIHELLRVTTEGINRPTLLANDFRSFHPFNLDLQPRSLASVVRDCLGLESIQANDRGVRIECDVPLDLPDIMADGAKLKQILLNLCKNAIETTPNGGTVAMRGYTNGGKVYLDVRDDGEGISEGIEVFKPFATNKSDGLGLGLFITQQIVLAHGGMIGYTSKKGEGTVFHLSFPIHCNEQSEAFPSRSSLPRRSELPTRKRTPLKKMS